MKRPTQPDNYEPLPAINLIVVWLTSVILWIVTKINHVNRARVLIGWQLPTHVCQSFTRQIRVYQHEKVGKSRGKFHLSPPFSQRVCRLFLCRSHTQLELTNMCLPTLRRRNTIEIHPQLVGQDCFVAGFRRCFRFSPCVINLSPNKNICCGLKKVFAKSRARVYFEQQLLALSLVFFIKLRTCHATNLLVP